MDADRTPERWSEPPGIRARPLIILAVAVVCLAIARTPALPGEDARSIALAIGIFAALYLAHAVAAIGLYFVCNALWMKCGASPYRAMVSVASIVAFADSGYLLFSFMGSALVGWALQLAVFVLLSRFLLALSWLNASIYGALASVLTTVTTVIVFIVLLSLGGGAVTPSF